jgi:thiaminase (transcriptional activator TenA)
MSEGRAGVASILHEQGSDAWQAAVNHPMVRDIADGSLPHEAFRRYFTQNVLYLEEYARAIGLIVGKAPDRDAVTVLARFLAQIVENEIPANLAFLDRLGGDPDTVAGRGVMLPATHAYTRHLLSVCALGDCADGLTAVLPCQWSYGELARPLAAHPPSDPIYADWIGMFGNEHYDGLVAQTTALLDRLVDPSDERRMTALSRIFETSTRYEAEFWDMAYGDAASVGPSSGPSRRPSSRPSSRPSRRKEKR